MLKLGSEELHVMLDLETLGTSSSAAITQIGGCVFQPATRVIKDRFNYYVDPETCTRLGLKADWKVIKWWMTQSDEARAAFNRDDLMDIKDALIYLQRANWQGIQCVWSHGAGFDIPILESAFKAAKLDYPWNYKSVRDTRTLFWLCPNVEWPENILKHNAESDAVAQAGAVSDALHKLGAV